MGTSGCAFVLPARGLPVDGPAAGGEDEPLHPRRQPRLDEAQGGHHVLLRVEDRILAADPHVDLGREVQHRLRPQLPHQVRDPGVLQVHAHEVRPGGHVGLEAAAQVVQHGHLVAFRHAAVRRVAADEPGPAGDEDAHPFSKTGTRPV